MSNLRNGGNVEDSDAGRDSRYLPGWWIYPGVILGIAFWAAIFLGVLL